MTGFESSNLWAKIRKQNQDAYEKFRIQCFQSLTNTMGLNYTHRRRRTQIQTTQTRHGGKESLLRALEQAYEVGNRMVIWQGMSRNVLVIKCRTNEREMRRWSMHESGDCCDHNVVSC